MDMLFAGHTAKEVWEAKKKGERYIINPPVLSTRSGWKKEQMEKVKEIIGNLDKAGLLPSETIFIFTGNKKHPIEMSECILGEEEGVVFHAIAVHSARIRDIFEDLADEHNSFPHNETKIMEELFIAKVLLHEMGHFVKRSGNGMKDLSSEEDAEAYSWEHMDDYLKVIISDEEERKQYSFHLQLTHAILLEDYWLYLSDKKETSLRAEIRRLKSKLKEKEKK